MRFSLIILILVAGLRSLGQSGPAGVGMQDGSSALKLWLDADKSVFIDTLQKKTALSGDRVMLWKDLSGSNNDVFATSDSSRPTFSFENSLLNGNSALRFTRNGGNQNKRNFLVSKSFPRTNDITIYCVFHALSKSAGTDVTPVKSSFFNLNMWYYGSGLVEGGVAGTVNDISLAMCDTSLAAGGGDSTIATDYCVKTPASINKTFFANLQKQAWTGKLSIAQNGSVPVEMFAGNQPINCSQKYYIGTTSDLSTPLDVQCFDGYIANVLVYNRLLNAAEKIILENHLSARYNMPLLSNDLYKFDEVGAGNFDFDLIGIGKALDGSHQNSAKADGLIEIAKQDEFEKGDFTLIGHNGKSLLSHNDDHPEGVQSQVERQWICSRIGKKSKIDLYVDPSIIPSIGKEDLVLLIDTDNDGTFSDEKLGEGMLPVNEVVSNGRFAFRNITLNNGNRFTFGRITPICQSGCETFFTPNGDGLADVYFLEQTGKTSIYDRAGNLIKAVPTPSYWDGTNEKGQLATPGIYFLITNEDVQKTVTLIR